MSNARMRVAAPIVRVGKSQCGITEHKFIENGLKVLTMPDPSTAGVTVVVVYRVGSRNEGPGETGSAHFFEHLMFKGSKKFNANKGNNLDELFKRVGAQLNAYTSNDQTVYFEKLPAEYMELALAVEADRMRNLRMTKADRNSEMTVVRNEMEQGENHPGQVMHKQMWATAFTQHPYHHDTIGSRTEVENVPMENMRDFYNTYYWPNNATLIIAGNSDERTMLELAYKHFGKIPRSPHKIPRVYTVEPVQQGERRFEIRRAGQLQSVSIGFHVPNAMHADMPALQVLAEVLGSSVEPACRLYQRLVEADMVSSVWAGAREMRDPSLFEISAELTAKASLAEVETAILEEIGRIKKDLVGDNEVSRIKEAYKVGKQLALADVTSYAFSLAEAESVADWRWKLHSQDAFAAVTPEDIRRVALKYLNKDNRTVGCFIPRTEEELAAVMAAATTEEPESVAVKAKTKVKPKRPEVVAKTVAKYLGKVPQRQPLSQRISTSTLANGLTVNVLSEGAGKGVVAVGIAVKAGNYFEDKAKQNLADIVGDMLPMGSVGMSKIELADEMTKLGMSTGVRFTVGAFLAQTSAQVLTGHLGRYLSLVGTVMRKPLFAQEELDRQKVQQDTSYKRASDNPAGVAQNLLGNVIYQATDTFHQKTFAEQRADLAAMTLSDVEAFHKASWTPSSTIITIVGDIEAKDAVAQAEAAFAEWQGPQSAAISVPTPAMPEARTLTEQMHDKPGIAIIIGRPSLLKRTDADYQAVQVAQRILGGDTLTARLGKKLREEGGLTYGVTCAAWDQSHGGAPWYISLSTNAMNVEPALKMAQDIFADFVANGITEDELKTQVDNMVGSHTLNLTSLWQLAFQIAQCSALGISLDTIDQYSTRLRALTVADVNAAIKKHFDTEHFVTVIAGEVK